MQVRVELPKEIAEALLRKYNKPLAESIVLILQRYLGTKNQVISKEDLIEVINSSLLRNFSQLKFEVRKELINEVIKISNEDLDKVFKKINELSKELMSLSSEVEAFKKKLESFEGLSSKLEEFLSDFRSFQEKVLLVDEQYGSLSKEVEQLKNKFFSFYGVSKKEKSALENKITNIEAKLKKLKTLEIPEDLDRKLKAISERIRYVREKLNEECSTIKDKIVEVSNRCKSIQGAFSKHAQSSKEKFVELERLLKEKREGSSGIKELYVKQLFEQLDEVRKELWKK